MNVRLDTGTCTSLEGFAFNDFELMALGDTSTVYGESNNLGCSLHDAVLTQR